MSKRFGFLLALILLVVLVTPVAADPAATPAAAAACPARLTVAWGDTLRSIAARCGTTIAALLAANPGIRNPDRIYAGQIINIPGGTTPPPPPAPGATDYIVRPGDTLSKIAARFGVSLNALLAANPQIRNRNFIYVGQRIHIPGKATPGPTAQRINFAAGATSAIVEGSLAANGTTRYVVKAAAGQLMDVSTQTSQGDVILIIFGADGNVLISDHAGATAWRGHLPTTQDYFIDVRAVGPTAAKYQLQVIIPQRISFAPGHISGSVSASAPVFVTHNYVVKAAGGQTMTVNTTTTQGQVILVIYGADGEVLISDHAGATTWTGTLPTTQDYLIDVHSVGSATAHYTLTVTIQ